MSRDRSASVKRTTRETDIELSLSLDGSGRSSIDTGIGFLDHMLELFAFHGSLDLEIKCSGDLEVDTHHTTEDIAIALGQAIREALGDKKGIERYGMCYLPMDETLARIVLDFSGRSCCVFRAEFTRDSLGSLAIEDIREFFMALSANAGLTLHAEVLYGSNDHHRAESIFKGLGRAVKSAISVTSDRILSTKGVI